MSDGLVVPIEVIERRIYLIRGQKVMLDRELAELYGVPTRRLNEQVKRNRKRFPEDFMFQLTFEEAKTLLGLRSQNATLKRGQHLKYAPYGFTEQGVAMLSSVLNSDRAIQVNIVIMRAFVKLRELLSTHKDILQKLDDLERKYQRHDAQIKVVFDAIRRLMHRSCSSTQAAHRLHTARVQSGQVTEGEALHLIAALQFAGNSIFTMQRFGLLRAFY